MVESTPVGQTLLAAFILLFAVVAFYLPRPVSDRQGVMPIAILAFVIKAMLVPLYFMLLQTGGLAGFGYPDTLRYHEWALEMSTEIRFGLPKNHFGWTILSNGYYIMCAYIYTYIGANTLLPRLLNVMFASMSLLYVWRIAKLFFDDKIARIAVWLTAFLPFTMLTVLEQRKDPVAQFFALVAFYHGIKVMRMDEGWQRNVFWMILPLVPLYFVRSGFILPFLLIMFIGFVLLRRNFATAVAAFIPALLLLGAVAFLAPPESRLSIRANVDRVQGKAAQGESATQFIGLMKYAYISSPAEIWKAPFSGGLVLLTPFPPTLGGKHLPSLLGPWFQLFSLALYPFLLAGVLNIIGDREQRDRMLLILYPALFLMVIGAVNPSVTRYREVVYPVILILIAFGLRLPRNLLSFVAVYGLLLVFAIFIYAFRLGSG